MLPDLRPQVGFAAVKLLEQAGCTVEVPPTQVCCGQPAYNSGDRKTAREIARQVVDLFEGYDYVVAPSGSCAARCASSIASRVISWNTIRRTGTFGFI